MKRFFPVLVALLLAACATTSGPAVDKSKMAEGYFMKGLSYLQEQKFELASVEFNRSIQTDSNYKQSYYMLGFISDYRKQYEDAIEYYQHAISIDSDYSEAYNAMGADYFYQKKYKEAIRAFSKALENKLYPTPHIPYVNMGRVYMAQKEYDKAIAAYSEAKRYASSDFVTYELGLALMEAGKTKDAVAAFREGLTISPQNLELRYRLGIALLKAGDKNAARQEFKKVAEAAPSSSQALQARDYLKTLR